jgi:hypothetical protein
VSRLAGGVHIEHPDAAGRRQGAKSYAYVAVDRGLKSGKLDKVPLSEDDLIRLIASAAQTLITLRSITTGDK